MSKAATITQAKIARAIRAAKKAGATQVEVCLPGKASFIVRLTDKESTEVPLARSGRLSCND